MKFKSLLKGFPVFMLLFGSVTKTGAQSKGQPFGLEKLSRSPQLSIQWDRYYDYAGITEICAKLARAFPELVKLETIGDSQEGRRLWVLTITDFSTGDPDRKPAFYLDGNIPNNEVQASEFALYTAWYLAENFQDNSFIKQLLQERTFYILPSIHPDARDQFMHSRKNAAFFKTEQNQDENEVIDQNLANDVNQDGFITYMRRKSVNGQYVQDPQNPHHLTPPKPGQKGEYDLLGFERFGNGSSTSQNFSYPGHFDLNRDWAWNWRPDYLQPGAAKYPFSLPETRAIKNFVILHPNIAGAQHYSTLNNLNQQMGPKEKLPLPILDDTQVYAALGDFLEEKIPGYFFQNAAKEVENEAGGELAWFKGARGIFTFLNLLRSPYFQENTNFIPDKKEGNNQEELNSHHSNPEAFVEWKPFQHPIYGLIEIGGLKENYSKVVPLNLLEEEAHRLMVLSLLQAYHLPQLDVQDVETKKLANGLMEVTAKIVNTRLFPTHSNQDLYRKIERPDYISLLDSTVVSGFIINELGKEENQKLSPARLQVASIPGNGFVRVKWVVSAKAPNLTIEVDSRKGGLVKKSF